MDRQQSIETWRPLGWPATIVVELLAEKTGNKSVMLGHRISDANEAGIVYADGSIVLVWVDRNGATLPLPDTVRAACVG